jgi:mannose-6-phosphate isomerase-like protein (cupin superfamily)
MSTEKATGYVFRPGEGRQIDLGNFTMTVKGDESSTSSLFTLLEADEPPNFGPPMHIHHGIAEAFYVLDGEYLIFMNDEEFHCPAGSFIFVPAEQPHGFRVGDVQSRKLTRTSTCLLPWSGTSMNWAMRSDLGRPPADPRRDRGAARR